MPPKRKAPNSAGDATDSGTSPMPRKKTKAEAKAAAKEWAENRRKKATAPASASPSYVRSGRAPTAAVDAVANSGPSVPTPRKTSKAEALAAAKRWHETRNLLPVSGACVSSPPPGAIGNLNKDQSKRVSGGNTFLKSLRTDVQTPVLSKKEDPPPAALDSVKPATTVVSDNGSAGTTSSSAMTPPAQRKSTVKSMSIIRKVLRFLLFSLGLALNVAAILSVMKNQLSSFDEFERQHDMETTRLSAAVSKSNELEAVLRTGVSVLEEKVQRMRETMGIGYVGGGHALHEMQLDEDLDADLLSSEDKQSFHDALRILEEHLGDEQL
jgi:hypothetical protein